MKGDPRTPLQSETILRRFAPLFEPRTIAVVGASATGGGLGNRMIRLLRETGFDGDVYPIHPTEARIQGVPAYRSLADTPKEVDYAFVAVAAERVPMILNAANGRVRFAQVVSSGFSEAEGGRAREVALLQAARSGGMRLLGPNCMGIHSPRGHLTFVDGGPNVPGGVAVMSQSGGLAIDLLQRGRTRGLAFRSVVSLGNCADLGPCDFLECFLEDPETRVIGAYLEHVAEGRRFFERLRAANAAKPVVLLKGGRTLQGQRAAISHTGALADDGRIWESIAKQTGATLVDSFEEFVDALVAFQVYAPRALEPSGRVIVFGNGGGASILAVDYLARRGLHAEPLNDELAEALSVFKLPAGASVANPIDIPANVLSRDGSAVAQEILELVASKGEADAVMIHLNLEALLAYKDVDVLGALVRATARVRQATLGRVHLSIALRSSGLPETEHHKREAARLAMASGVPVFDEISNQVRALQAVHALERFRQSRAVGAPHGARGEANPKRDSLSRESEWASG